MTHAHRAPAALALGLALALASACGDSEPTPAPQAPAAAAPATPSPEDDDAEAQETTIGEPGTLPDNFPPEFLPPGSSSTVWSAWSGAGQLVAFKSDLRPEEIYGHFTTGLGASGWNVTHHEQVDEETWEVVATKDKSRARISITQGETGSEFAIAITEQP